MHKNIFKLIAGLAILSFVVEAIFSIHRHQPEGPAKCLDGSPAALYYQEGRIKDKIVIFFEGGGLCRGDGLSNMLDYCYNRSLTNLGSSTQYPDTTSFDQWSLISNLRDFNPIFYDWIKVFIPYCDGSLHQGSRNNPVEYKGRPLYFRGANNTLAHFDFLDKRFGLFDLSEIVMSGTSAGAMATYIWGNYVYERAKYPQNVLLIPDSGIFNLRLSQSLQQQNHGVLYFIPLISL